MVLNLRTLLRLRSTEQRSTLRIPTRHGNEHRMSVTMGCCSDMSSREYPLRISLMRISSNIEAVWNPFVQSARPFCLISGNLCRGSALIPGIIASRPILVILQTAYHTVPRIPAVGRCRVSNAVLSRHVPEDQPHSRSDHSGSAS